MGNKKIKKKTMIKYKDLKEKKYTLIEFKSIVKKALNTEHLTNPWIHQIVFYALSNLNFKKLKNNRNSVDKYSKKVIEIFFPSGVLNKTNPSKYFFEIILGFNELPFRYKSEIENKVKADLKEVETLLNEYRKIPFINENESESKKPRNHEEKVDLVFYKRTKMKREEILKYFFDQLDEVSIQLAEKPNQNSVIIYNDAPEIIKTPFIYPYFDLLIDDNRKFAYGIDWEKLDRKKINLLENKWNYLKQEFRSYEYDAKTNNLIIKEIKPKKILKKLIKTSKKLEALKNRTLIFKELNHLFLKNKYYGFYGIALPQVEGLFTDMLNLMSKKAKSLPLKVNALRETFPDLNYAFDYYEFFLPTQRNKFSHTGEDSNIKAKSYQILLDLIYLTDIYKNLDSPIVELDSFINGSNTDFKNIGNYAAYLILIQKVQNQENSNYSAKKIDKFNSKLFINDRSVVPMLRKLKSDYEISFNKIFNILNDYFGHNYSIENLSNREVANASDQINKYILNDALNYFFSDYLKLIFDTIDFAENYLKIIYTKNREIEEILQKITEMNIFKYGKIIKGKFKDNIETFSPICSFEHFKN